ncbi:MAG: hypothetical protein U9N62_00560 [Thermotogota bacterium]|nr:hypothetical protein [Thermotogota bacterium]
MKENYTKIITIMFISISILFIASCAPESEINPPDTSIKQMQSVYGQSGIRMVLSGVDDKTPAEKLTYQYAFYIKNENEDEETDEEQLFLEGNSESNELFIDSLELEEGEYLVKIAAVNEFGLADKTPAEGTFRVDLTPPEMPVINYQIISGEVNLSFTNKNTSDIAGYEMLLSNSIDKKAFSSTQGSFTFKADKGDHYEIAVKAFDNAGNSSQENQLLIDTTIDEAPRLEDALPEFLGNGDTHIPISFFDDWAKHEKITVQATFNGKEMVLGDEGLDIDVSMMNEGTHTLHLRLIDDNDNIQKITKDIFIDLTPPKIPFDCTFKDQGQGYFISWDAEREEMETFKIYGFNKEEDITLLGTVDGRAFSTPKRYLHYVITSVDKAGNESSPSYPIRSYNEQYRPITSSDLSDIRENTLLTSLYSPYVIDKTIQILPGILLGIEKGVELIFTENGFLQVEGQILSIPSKSSKERKITINFDETNNEGSHLPLIQINGGSVWLNESKVFGNKAPLTLFEVNDGGEFRAQGISVIDVDTVINSVDADIVVLDDSIVQATVFATGSSAKSFRISGSKMTVVEGMNITNIQQLEINDSTIESTQTALNLNGFTNAVMNDSTISGANTLVINKLSAVDAKSVNVYATNDAISLHGASTLNLRDVTVSASNTGIFVDRSAYLCAIESIIKDSKTGLNILNPNVYFNKLVLTGNHFAVKGKTNEQWLENGLKFIGNEIDMIE